LSDFGYIVFLIAGVAHIFWGCMLPWLMFYINFDKKLVRLPKFWVIFSQSHPVTMSAHKRKQKLHSSISFVDVIIIDGLLPKPLGCLVKTGQVSVLILNRRPFD
jgi:hypothetical protein